MPHDAQCFMDVDPNKETKMMDEKINGVFCVWARARFFLGSLKTMAQRANRIYWTMWVWT